MNRSVSLACLAVVVVAVGGCPPRDVQVEPQTEPTLAWQAENLHPLVRLDTSLGSIVVELDATRAPISVHNFVQYVATGYYDGTVFHRVVPDFVIQGGGHDVHMALKPGLRDPIKLESKNGLSNVVGTIAMARTVNPDTAQAQFFINVVDNSAKLDHPNRGGYAVFGHVVEGMDTVEAIRAAPVAAHPKYHNGQMPVVPVEPIVIRQATLLSDVDVAALGALAAKHRKALQDAERAERGEALRVSQEEARAVIARAELEAGHAITTTDSGLMYVDLRPGMGAAPEPTGIVEVHYRGSLLDGTIIDDSYARGTAPRFPLDRVILGWGEGVRTMRVGGKRRLIIPPYLAYGDQVRDKVPPNSTLVYDVELLSIGNGPGSGDDHVDSGDARRDIQAAQKKD